MRPCLAVDLKACVVPGSTFAHNEGAAVFLPGMAVPRKESGPAQRGPRQVTDELTSGYV